MRCRHLFGLRTAQALLACVAGLCFLTVPSLATARPGDLDRSFSGDGIVRVVGQEDKLFNTPAITVQPGIGIVVAGGRYRRGPGTDWSLTRRLFNGKLDTSFGAAGYREIEFSPGYAEATDVVPGPDGRLLVAGFAVAGDDPEEFPAEMVVARLDRDGALDGTFGDAGVHTVHPGTYTGRDVKMALAADGGIVLARSIGIHHEDPDGDFEISKLTSDGDLDTSFGGGGSKVIDFAGRQDQLTDLAIGRRGRIVVVGSTQRWRDGNFKRSDLAVARLTRSGQRDDSFSRNGRRVVDNGRWDLDPVIGARRDGRLVIASETGNQGDRIAVLRLARNGSLDEAFSRDGVKRIRIRDYARVQELALQRRGRVVVFATTAFVHPDRGVLGRDWALLRLARSGKLDRSFSRNGKLITDAGGNELDTHRRDLALQPNGRIVIGGAGCGFRPPGSDRGSCYIALARYRSDLRPAR